MLNVLRGGQQCIDRKKGFLDIGDPNFVCEFRSDLEMTTDSAGQRHVT